jgi:hypothetical protein
MPRLIIIQTKEEYDQERRARLIFYAKGIWYLYCAFFLAFFSSIMASLLLPDNNLDLRIFRWFIGSGFFLLFMYIEVTSNRVLKSYLRAIQGFLYAIIALFLVLLIVYMKLSDIDDGGLLWLIIVTIILTAAFAINNLYKYTTILQSISNRHRLRKHQTVYHMAHETNVWYKQWYIWVIVVLLAIIIPKIPFDNFIQSEIMSNSSEIDNKDQSTVVSPQHPSTSAPSIAAPTNDPIVDQKPSCATEEDDHPLCVETCGDIGVKLVGHGDGSLHEVFCLCNDNISRHIETGIAKCIPYYKDGTS